VARGDWDLNLDSDAIADLMSDEEAQDLAQEVGDLVAERAADNAPKATGGGAASIHAETDVDDQSAFADVSWDPDHFYLGFHELGTEHQPAQPFLRPALDSTQI